MFLNRPSRCSIVVSIPACHAGDPGSIPGNGDFFSFCFLTLKRRRFTGRLTVYFISFLSV